MKNPNRSHQWIQLNVIKRKLFFLFSIEKKICFSHHVEEYGGPQTVLIFARHLSIIRSISQVRFNEIQLRKENFSCLIFANDQWLNKRSFHSIVISINNLSKELWTETINWTLQRIWQKWNKSLGEHYKEYSLNQWTNIKLIINFQ